MCLSLALGSRRRAAEAPTSVCIGSPTGVAARWSDAGMRSVRGCADCRRWSVLVRELRAHDENHNGLTLFVRELLLEAGHAAEAIGDAVIHELGLVARGLQLGCLARIRGFAV